MRALIGISGVAGSGKDTTANFFVSEFDFVSISFADPLKRICADVFDWDENRLWGPSEERNKPDERYPRAIFVPSDQGEQFEADRFGVETEPEYRTEYLSARYALQTLGTEWGRDCYENIWVEYGIRLAKRILSSRGFIYTKMRGLQKREYYDTPDIQGVAIPDCRFKNEIKLMKNAGAILIRIKRPGAGLSGSAGAHASEAEQLSIPDSEFDYVLENDGTIEDLKQKVIAIGEDLKLEKSKHKQMGFKWK